MSGSFCRTLYPFSGEQHQQGLSFQAGEVVKVVQALPGGWWEGEKDGARGWFPSSYVQVTEVRPEPLQVYDLVHIQNLCLHFYSCFQIYRTRSTNMVQLYRTWSSPN